VYRINWKASAFSVGDGFLEEEFLLIFEL